MQNINSLSEFTEREIKLFLEINRVFQLPVIVYEATAEQIEQLKMAGVKGVSRRQKK